VEISRAVCGLTHMPIRVMPKVFSGKSRSRSQAEIGVKGKRIADTWQKKYLLDSIGQTEYLAQLRMGETG
jgi:hypothetical protein